MAESKETSEVDLRDPMAFVGAAIKAGIEADNRQFSAWAESTMREIGGFLLHMHDYSDELPPELAEAYPEAVRVYFEGLPHWVDYGTTPHDIVSRAEQLPAETVAAIEPHMYRII